MWRALDRFDDLMSANRGFGWLLGAVGLITGAISTFYLGSVIGAVGFTVAALAWIWRFVATAFCRGSP